MGCCLQKEGLINTEFVYLQKNENGSSNGLTNWNDKEIVDIKVKGCSKGI